MAKEVDNIKRNKEIAERVKNLRKRLKLSQMQLAEKAGLSLGAIKQIETGTRWPRPETIQALVKALGIDRQGLFFSTESLAIHRFEVEAELRKSSEEVYRLNKEIVTLKDSLRRANEIIDKVLTTKPVGDPARQELIDLILGLDNSKLRHAKFMLEKVNSKAVDGALKNKKVSGGE